jgi:ribosomal protein L32E
MAPRRKSLARLVNGRDPFTVTSTVSHGKRTFKQRERDLEYTAEKYLKGWTAQQICDDLNNERHGEYEMSLQMVRGDIDLIHERWIASYLVDFDEAKSRELAHIDLLEQEYWSAWRKSQDKIEEIESEKIEDHNSVVKHDRPSYSRTRVKKLEKLRDGNVDYLRGIQWCIEQRCKIMGLSMSVSTQNINVNWRKQAEAQGIDPDGAMNELVEQFIEAATVGRESGGGSVGEGAEDPQGPGPDSQSS